MVLRSTMSSRRPTSLRPNCYHFSSNGVHSYRTNAQEESAWARTPESASIIKPPPYEFLDETQKHRTISYGSTYDWAKLRGWELANQGPGIRILSHILTFPLTVAHFVHKLDNLSSSKTEKTANTTLVVYCAGARAECTLPPIWWYEGLFALPDNITRLHLHFIGPEVVPPPPPPPSSSSASSLHYEISDQFEDQRGTRGEIKRSYYNGKLEEFFESEQYARSLKQRELDGSSYKSLLWLSNPGLGHPHLQDSWAPTIDYLITSQSKLGALRSSSSPPSTSVLVTSHSKNDQLSDLRAVMTSETSKLNHSGMSRSDSDNTLVCLRPSCSSFKSLRQIIDNCSEGKQEVVQANWGAFAFRSPNFF